MPAVVLAELDALRPEVLVLLGATAAKSLLGSRFRLMAERGRPLDSDLAPVVVATIHPSAILRGRDGEARQAQRELLCEDLASPRGARPRPYAASAAAP